MKNNSKKFSFITFEGGEGAGKTTLIQQIQKFLEKQGNEVVSTREPGGSHLGETVRQWLLFKHTDMQISPRSELMLFLASRAQHVEEIIKPALAANKIVLCDRFNDSTIVYQGIARGLGLDKVQNLCEFACDGVLPNLTFFLDVDPVEGLRRCRGVAKEHVRAGELDRIETEKLEFHQKVREGMQLLARKYPERIRVLDANQPQEAVLEQTLKFLENWG